MILIEVPTLVNAPSHLANNSLLKRLVIITHGTFIQIEMIIRSIIRRCGASAAAKSASVA